MLGSSLIIPLLRRTVARVSVARVSPRRYPGPPRYGEGVQHAKTVSSGTRGQGLRAYLERLGTTDATVAEARRLTQDFADMVRNLEGQRLDGWFEEAENSEASVMRRFAAGLRKDLLAVRAGLTKSWSNGPVERFVHKLKLLKRQGYGREGFELLRERVLAA